MIRTFWILLISAFTFILLVTGPAMAARGGGGGTHQFGGGVAFVSPTQDDLNSWISGLGVVGTKEVTSGYELFMNYEYRFSGTIFAMHFRPSYLSQASSGGGVSAKVSSVMFFPMLRLYPLENDFIRFFFQIGLGYGNFSLDISNNSGGSGTYSGGNFGANAGLGAYFCFTDSSCVVAEGSFRYLPMQRLTGNGNGLTGGTSRITQEDGELEVSNSDMAATLSGIQGSLAYQYNF